MTRAIIEIVLGKRPITPVMSIRFGVFSGQSATSQATLIDD